MISAAVLALALGGAPSADLGGAPPSDATTQTMRELAWVQRLDERVDLDLTFRDETGQLVRLRDFTRGKPVILVLAYYRCPQLCNLVLNGVLDAVKAMPLRLGQDFEIVTVSFDARERPDIASAKKANYAASLAYPGADAHWHFLTGDEPQIARLAAAVGFRYAYDAKHDRFDHASGVTVLTPDGVVSRYLFGIRYSPRDLKLAVVEASAGRVGTLADTLLLFCFHYDAANGRYAFAVMTAMRAAGVLTIGLLAFFLSRAWRRERRRLRTETIG